MKQLELLRRCLIVSATVLVSVFLASAQTTGGQQGSQPRSTRGGTTNRGTTQQRLPTGMQTQQQPSFPEMRRPMFLQGKVILSDGTPAPPNVLIERVCSGRPIPEGYTDSKGRFGFEVGRNSNFIADASFSGTQAGPGSPWGNTGGFSTFGQSSTSVEGISERDLSGCELRASLPGYRSTRIELTGRRMFDNPDVGTIVLTKLGNVSGFTISATTLHAPKKAKKSYENGVKQARKKKWEKAQKELEKAVGAYPQYAEAWYLLGQVYEMEKKPAEARQAYAKALAADGKFISPYLRLARMAVGQGNWGEALEATSKILKLNPYDFPDAYFYNSLANLNLNNLSAAEKSAREAIKLKADRRFPQLEHVLGLSLAYQNNYREAAQHLKRYLELLPQANNAAIVKKQITQLESFVAQQQASTAPQQ